MLLGYVEIFGGLPFEIEGAKFLNFLDMIIGNFIKQNSTFFCKWKLFWEQYMMDLALALPHNRFELRLN